MEYKPKFEIFKQKVVLTDYSPSLKLGEFHCSDPDYAIWLFNDASMFIDQSIAQVKVLLDSENDDKIIGYIALSADSIELSINEKKKDGLVNNKIPKAVPALKIGKLAIDNEYEHQGYGAYLLILALAIAQQINFSGIACRYISLDADVSVFPTNNEFYARQGFNYNNLVNSKRLDDLKSKGKGDKLDNISMRYDIYE